jgi:hypothetical protein
MAFAYINKVCHSIRLEKQKMRQGCKIGSLNCQGKLLTSLKPLLVSANRHLSSTMSESAGNL